MRGGTQVNTPKQEPGSAVRSSGKQFIVKPSNFPIFNILDEANIDALDAGNVSSTYNNGNE